MSGARRVVAEHADQAGFGRVIRVHRQRREVGGGTFLLWCTAIPAGIAVLVLALSGSPDWRLPLLGYAVIVVSTAVWLRWGPIHGGEARLWFGIADGGLIIWSRDSSGVAIGWDGLSVRRLTTPISGLTTPVSVVQLVWWDGQEQVLVLRAVSGRGDLVRAVESSRPVPRRLAHRLAGIATVGVASALVVWFAAVPVGLEVVLDERPDDMEHFYRMCEGGDPFGQTAPYHGAGPHPVAVYEESGYLRYTDGYVKNDDGGPRPDATQLVGCSRLVDRIPKSSCSYVGGYTQTFYQGRYRVDVYEARTGRAVRSFEVDGRSQVERDCSDVIFVEPDSSRERALDMAPDEAAYAARLARLVDGKPG